MEKTNCVRFVVAEVTKAMQAREEEKRRKAQQQLMESKQSKARSAAEDDDEEALDASLDQVGTFQKFQSSYFFHARMHVLAMIHKRL
jgi:hypothetical protein